MHTFSSWSCFGKYRQKKGPRLLDWWVKNTTAQHYVWLWPCRCGQVGFDWICDVWFWNTERLQLPGTWWSCEGVPSKLRSGKDAVLTTLMKRRPDNESQNNTRHCSGFDSLAQWLLDLFSVYLKVRSDICSWLGQEVWIDMDGGQGWDVGD